MISQVKGWVDVALRDEDAYTIWVMRGGNSDVHHSAVSSNELLDLHTTQTQSSKVSWGARFSGHWVVTSMFSVCISYSQEDITQTTEENLKWKKFSRQSIFVLQNPFKF